MLNANILDTVSPHFALGEQPKKCTCQTAFIGTGLSRFPSPRKVGNHRINALSRTCCFNCAVNLIGHVPLDSTEEAIVYCEDVNYSML